MSRYRLYRFETERLARQHFRDLDRSSFSRAAKDISEKTGRPYEYLMSAMDRRDYMYLGESLILYSSQCEFEDTGAIDTETTNILFMETNQILMGSKTIFVQGQDLVRALYESKMDVSFESIVSGGNVSFSVSLEKVIVDGLQVVPFLFSVADDAESDGKLISIIANEARTSCASLDAEGYSKYIPTFPMIKKAGDLSLSIYLKLAVSLLVYMRAFPECVLNKFPSNMPAKEILHTKNNNNISHVTITSPRDHKTGTCIHLRRGHFRSLHDKRFKRDIDGNIKIIWVRDSVVGGKIDPYTIESILE